MSNVQKWLLYNENSFIFPTLNSLMKKSARFAAQETPFDGVVGDANVGIVCGHFASRNEVEKKHWFSMIVMCWIEAHTVGLGRRVRRVM